MNIGDLLFGKLDIKYLGVNIATPGEDSDGVYIGNKFQIDGKATIAGIEVSSQKNANDANIGNFAFINRNNANLGGISRRVPAYISCSVATSDNNANGTSGGRLKFFVKPDNGIIAETWRISDKGRLSNNQSDGTAQLHLKAGSASANTAPIKLTSGTLMSIAEVGAIEFDGNNLYITF